MKVTITTHITTGDGNTYQVSVTYDQDADMPENAELVARELDTEEKENYVNQRAAFLGHEAEDFAFARAFDLSLIDPESGMEIQPASGVKVSIRLLDTDIYNNEGEISLLHFGDEVETVDYTLNDNAVEFTAEGFSVYVLTEAKPPYTGPSVIKSLDELSEHSGSSYGYYLSYVDKNQSQLYFTNSLNNNGAFVENTDINEAAIWYFEPTGNTNKYRISTFVNNNKKYMKQSPTDNNKMELTDNASNATIFELKTSEEGYSAETNKYFFKVDGQNRWLQHSGKGNGIRLYTTYQDASTPANNTNSQIIITYVELMPDPDYYGLDGKGYCIAYVPGTDTGIGLTNTATAQSVQIDNDNNRLTADTGTVARWTFENTGGTNYKISTKIDGATKYLTLNETGLSLSDAPCVFTLNSYNGKFSFKVNDRYLGVSTDTFSSSTTETWFILADLEEPATPVSWENLSYTMQRNSTVTLDEIFTACGITAITSDYVDSVVASDPEILQGRL